MTESQVLEEYTRAKQVGRQPLCPFCKAPLEVSQTQSEFIFWRWNHRKKAFDKVVSDGDADKPFCVACGARDWDFIDFKLIHF